MKSEVVSVICCQNSKTLGAMIDKIFENVRSVCRKEEPTYGHSAPDIIIMNAIPRNIQRIYCNTYA